MILSKNLLFFFFGFFLFVWFCFCWLEGVFGLLWGHVLQVA